MSGRLVQAVLLVILCPLQGGLQGKPLHFSVKWWTYSPGDTEMAPSYAPPFWRVFAMASACASVSQPELTKLLRSSGFSKTNMSRKSLAPMRRPAPTETEGNYRWWQ